MRFAERLDPATLADADFAPRFDTMHRTFLGYPAALAQTTASTDSGKVSGTADKDLIVFKGIPFAAPPIAWRRRSRSHRHCATAAQ